VQTNICHDHAQLGAALWQLLRIVRRTKGGSSFDTRSSLVLILIFNTGY